MSSPIFLRSRGGVTILIALLFAPARRARGHVGESTPAVGHQSCSTRVVYGGERGRTPCPCVHQYFCWAPGRLLSIVLVEVECQEWSSSSSSTEVQFPEYDYFRREVHADKNQPVRRRY